MSKQSKGQMLFTPGTQSLYEIPFPTDLAHTYLALEVDVEQLCDVIRALEKDHTEIIFIHDF